jgi:phosphotriesterase-related protein
MLNRRELVKQALATGVSVVAFPQLGQAESVSESPPALAQSVLGPLDASKLGYTLPHEHIADGPYYLDKWPKGSRAEFTSQAVIRLKQVRAAGISTIVDLTTYDVWRDIHFLEEVSRKSGINMIAATGQRFFPPVTHMEMPARTIEGLAEFFKDEIEHGIDGTNIKAGVIKIGIIAKEPTALEAIGLRAAVRASKATRASIRIHTHAADRAADNLIDILNDERMNPKKVSFDHSDDSGDLEYFLGLVRRGYSLGMDHVHRGNIVNTKPSFERRAECIKLLIDAGFAENLFLSQDLELGGSLLAEGAQDSRSKLDPPDGFLFTTEMLIPQLRRTGVSDASIHTMTVDNPRRFFGLS